MREKERVDEEEEEEAEVAGTNKGGQREICGVYSHSAAVLFIAPLLVRSFVSRFFLSVCMH